MYKVADVLFAALTVFQGYCLQYFLGSFLESRMKSRWNGLCVAVMYVVLRMAVMWVSPPGYEDYKMAVGTLASSLCIISFLALCFYKAFRPVTVFLVVSFRAVLDISSYAAAILIGGPGNRLSDVWNWCVRERIITSEKSLALVSSSCCVDSGDSLSVTAFHLVWCEAVSGHDLLVYALFRRGA